MPSDRDIYRAANLLIRQDSGDAELVAAHRADLMHDRGDQDGQLALAADQSAGGSTQ